MYKLTHLKNGAVFIFSPLKGFKSAAFSIVVKAGAKYEPKKMRGISHFIEHLLFKGSRKYSYKQIKREIEGRGGLLNGYTSYETTAYYAQFLKKNIKKVADILTDMVFFPLFRKQDIDKERRVVFEEIKMHDDLPHIKVVSLLDKLLWPDYPLGEDIIGDFDTVGGIKREDLTAFKEYAYAPQNVIISIAGDLDYESIIEQTQKIMPSAKGKKTSFRGHFLKPLTKEIKFSVEEKTINQTHLCLGFRGPSYKDRQRYAFEVLNAILGANMSSRLFEAVREKRGLAYDVSSEARKYRETGALVIHLGLDKNNIGLAFKTVLKELDKLKSKYASRKELERAKDYIFGQAVMNLERPAGRMFYLADSYFSYGRIILLEELKEKIYKVNAEDIRRLAKKIFNYEKMRISAVGNIRQKDIAKLAESI